MDRRFAYAGAIPLDTDLLLTNKVAYIGLAKLAAAVLGSNTLVNGATCTPTSPASLNVNISGCEIYSLQQVDPNAYGDVPADTVNQIVKQGINLGITQLAITPPGTSGYSQNYLIEFSFNEVDGGSTVLTYYNASNPAAPFNGPNNTGAPNNTVRQDQVLIQAKAGIAAPTGTQTTPTADTGFVGLFVVIVANGQTTITSGNISTVTGAPLITETLTQKLSQTTADIRYAQQTQVQTGQFIYGVDTSVTANTVTANLSPAITSYTAGMNVRIKIANANTGASTLNLNGIGAVSIVRNSGTALLPGDLPLNGIIDFTYDGTKFEITNSNIARFNNVQVLTTSGNFTVPTGVYSIKLNAWGAGGGGSGGNGTIQGSGGGAGGFGEQYFSTTPGTVYSYSIGAPGGGGLVNNSGATGGTTTFGGLITSIGGTGGGVTGVGGLPGTSSATNNINGGGGYRGSATIAGFGGSAPQGGMGGVPDTPGAGTPGGGGCGGSSSGSGGIGAAGRIIVTW